LPALKMKEPESLALGPVRKRLADQGAEGRFIWQLVGVLET
jgi:hypothetical protein